MNFSPHITLVAKQRRSYILGRLGVLLCAFILSVFFLFDVFFPEAILRYGHKNVDPIFRIAEPETQGSVITWNGSLTRTADYIDVSLTSDNHLAGAPLILQKGFVAHIKSRPTISDFPEARFDQSLSFPPGTLLTGKRGHATTSLSGARHSFDSALTLHALGYAFERSQETTGEQWSTYSKGSLLTIRSIHPPGTLFYERDTQKTYLYTGQSLTPIQPTQEQSLITVHSNSRTAKEVCTLTPKRFTSSTYTCRLSAHSLQGNPGKDYLFTLNDVSDPNIQQITLTFTPEVSLTNLAARIGSVREMLKK